MADPGQPSFAVPHSGGYSAYGSDGPSAQPEPVEGRTRRRDRSLLAEAMLPPSDLGTRQSSDPNHFSNLSLGTPAGQPAAPSSSAPPPSPELSAPPKSPTVAPAPRPAPAEPAPSGRAKTRLLGFHSASGLDVDPFDQPASRAHQPVSFPTGWLIILEGPGRGACFTLTEGVSQIGRGPDQAVRLDYGDQAISRQGHASVAYDDELGQFYLGHGGKLNLVRLNGRPVLSTDDLASGDQIRIGETTLLFVAFCGPEFSWSGDGAGHESSGDAARE